MATHVLAPIWPTIAVRMARVAVRDVPRAPAGLYSHVGVIQGLACELWESRWRPPDFSRVAGSGATVHQGKGEGAFGSVSEEP